MNPQPNRKPFPVPQTAQAASAVPENARECPTESRRAESPPPNPQSETSEIQNPPPSLTDRQLAALDMLLAGTTNAAVSRALGIDPKTLYRWRVHDPAFREHLEQRRRERCDEAADHLSASLTQALAVFDRHLKDLYAPTCFRAARALLTIAQIGRLVNPPDQKPERHQQPTTHHRQLTTDN